MKVRIGKKIMVYDFSEEEWVKSTIVHIEDGTVSLKGETGTHWECELSELDDYDCYREM